ncbi:MAG: protein kinase [Gemmataceae bacterium]|nr:protein kinase [Gemmataceae bacterium]
MLDLQECIRTQCADVDPALLEMHFRRLAPSYFERHSVTDIVRHLHLLARLTGPNPVEVEVRTMTSRTFEVLVVGEDYSGTVACITTALAADGFDLEDVQVAPYLDSGREEGADSEPWYFIVTLWISGSLRGWTLPAVADRLRARLRAAFVHLAVGNFLEAQAAAADTTLGRGDPTRLSGSRTGIPPATSYEGMLLGSDFRLERKLMAGGTGEVYLATQLSLDRTVAVKVVRHEGNADDDLLARVSREAVVLGQFNCSHIVQVLAAGTLSAHGGGVVGWMAMEYMSGGDLARWMASQGVPAVEIGTRWFRQALEGLHYAHRRSVLHRDLKPHNLLLSGENDLKVSDFGLLKLIQRSPGGKTPRSTIQGTPHYMSPEQAMGERLDERSDIFSLGTTFFHVFSGRLPFSKSTAQATLVQIAQEDAPRLTDTAPMLPRPLSILIGRMMARRLEERYQDVGVILEDLASYERRGLLRCADTSTSLPVPPALLGNAETQAYEPPPAPEVDDVVI